MSDAPHDRADDLSDDRAHRHGDDPLTRRQREILLAAVELLREEGLGGLTVRGLAERIGFSEAALYRHFTSKEEVLVALLARLSEERLLAPMRRLAADRSASAGDRVERMYEHQLATLFDLDGVPMLFVAEAIAGGDEALVARARSVAGELFGLYTGVLEEVRRGAGAGDDGGGGRGAGRPAPDDLAPILVGYAAATAVRLRLGNEEIAGGSLDREHVLRVGRFLVRTLVGEGSDRTDDGAGAGAVDEVVEEER